MNSTTIAAPAEDDATLVGQCLTGDHQAFREIVARHQSLVCALAFSATGSQSRSEDLAQETFVTAWKQLRTLREPGRLRPWLCGIARHTIHGELRRQGREPVHAAAPLDHALELPSADPLPSAEAVSHEEMALMWREIGRLPEIYREPLILFYREHHSVERVAAALEASPEAVMQRLSRGRRQLQERMLAFVESTLERSNPGPQFALQVYAALPVLAVAGQTAAAGTLAKTGAAAKGGWLGSLLAALAPFTSVFAAIGITWMAIRDSASARERRFQGRWMLLLWLSVCGFRFVIKRRQSLQDYLHLGTDAWAVLGVFIWWSYFMVVATMIVVTIRRVSAIRRQDAAAGLLSAAPPRSFRTVATALALNYLASAAWLPVIAWLTGDRTVAGILTGILVLLAAGNLYLLHRQSKTNRQQLADQHPEMLCVLWAFVLGVVNWRLDVWLASACHVSPEEMHRLLPMAIIHALTAILFLWIAALLFLTQPDAPPAARPRPPAA